MKNQKRYRECGEYGDILEQFAETVSDSRERTEDMLITRECDYAVRVIRALSGEERLSVSDICEKESITAPFAYKILKKLQKAKIVRGFRGVHGGYSLNRDLAEISLLDVYMAVDPEMMIIECLDPDYDCVRDGDSGVPCLVHKELAQIQQELWKMLGRKSLGELFGTH